MVKIKNNDDAYAKIEEVLNHPKIKIASFDSDYKQPWDYYYSVSGWFNENYFQLRIYSMFGNVEIDIPKGITDQKTLFRKEFKL